MNPQSFNRYSYCFNNPLRYVDPSGHQIEAYDWYYQQLCEENGIDPDAGYALFLEDGFVVAAVDIEAFEGWVEETPNPYDYWVEESALDNALKMAGGTAAVVVLDDWLIGAGWIDNLAIPAVFLGGLIWGAFSEDLVEIEISFAKNREKAVKSLVKVIEEHQSKLNNSPPNDPDRNKWKAEIEAAANSIGNHLSRMGPKA